MLTGRMKAPSLSCLDFAMFVLCSVGATRRAAILRPARLYVQDKRPAQREHAPQLAGCGRLAFVFYNRHHLYSPTPAAWKIV
jgi:hypothetical protein